jgi:hypothetical protein
MGSAAPLVKRCLNPTRSRLMCKVDRASRTTRRMNLGIETDAGSNDEAAFRPRSNASPSTLPDLFRARHALCAAGQQDPRSTPTAALDRAGGDRTLGARGIRATRRIGAAVEPGALSTASADSLGATVGLAVVADCAAIRWPFTPTRSRPWRGHGGCCRYRPMQPATATSSPMRSRSTTASRGSWSHSGCGCMPIDAAEVSDLPDDRLNSFEQALDAAALQELSARAAQYSLVPNASAKHSESPLSCLVSAARRWPRRPRTAWSWSASARWFPCLAHQPTSLASAHCAARSSRWSTFAQRSAWQPLVCGSRR